ATTRPVRSPTPGTPGPEGSGRRTGPRARDQATAQPDPATRTRAGTPTRARTTTGTARTRGTAEAPLRACHRRRPRGRLVDTTPRPSWGWPRPPVRTPTAAWA